MPAYPPTLILHPRYDGDSQLIWQAAVKLDWRIVRTQGWEGLLRAVSSELQRDGPAVIYGGHEWGQRVANALGVTLVSPPADWLVTLPEKFTRRWIAQGLLGDARAGSFGFPVFVKSLYGKQLASRVYHSPDDLPDVGDGVEVLVQEPVEWAFEYRTFVLGSVRCVASYARYGELDVSNAPSYASLAAVREFMSPLLAQQRMPQAVAMSGVVIDVGCIEGRGMAVVEANPAWCSGLYACDPDAALAVVAASCGVVVAC